MVPARLTRRQVVYPDASLHMPRGKKEKILSGLLGSSDSAAGGHSAHTHAVTCREEAGTETSCGGLEFIPLPFRVMVE